MAYFGSNIFSSANKGKKRGSLISGFRVFSCVHDSIFFNDSRIFCLAMLYDCAWLMSTFLLVSVEVLLFTPN